MAKEMKKRRSDQLTERKEWAAVVADILSTQNLTYDQLGRLLGVTGTTIGRWVRGEKTPQKSGGLHAEIHALHAKPPRSISLAQPPRPLNGGEPIPWAAAIDDDVRMAHDLLNYLASLRVLHPAYWALVKNLLTVMVTTSRSATPTSTPSTTTPDQSSFP